ncbi:MAG: hypothetical protein K6A82_03700 [Prevotella sp.]|nr:hypothetical protein [Prevotella sp.]
MSEIEEKRYPHRTLILMICFFLFIAYSCGHDDVPQNVINIDTSKVELDSTAHERDTIKAAIYTYWMSDIPVVEQNYKTVFVGNVINEDKSDVTDLISLKNPEYNEVEVSLLYNGELYYQKFIPSWNNTYNFFAKLPQETMQSGAVSYTAESFESYKSLHLFAEANYALSLDSIILHESYKTSRKNKTKLLLYSFFQELIPVSMDYPETGHLLKEDPIGTDKYDYIASVTYGRKGFLVVETNSPHDKRLVNKLLDGGNLSMSEHEELDKITAHVITFTQNCVPHVVSGGYNLVNECTDRIVSQPIYPIYCNACSVRTFSLVSLRHSVNME